MDRDVSHSNFYSLIIDESTDIATAVIYMQCVVNGEVHSWFLGLVKLPGGTTPEIVDVVLKVLTSRNLSL